MARPNSGEGWWRTIFLLIAIFVLAADQLTKIWIRLHLEVGHTLFSIGIFRIDYIRNSGAAFGILQGYSWFFTTFSFIGALVILGYVLFLERRYLFLTPPRWIAAGLILGGTVGNLVDRVRLGYVTDFIDFTYWPAFNIADAAVTTGVILFAYTILSLFSEKPHEKV